MDETPTDETSASDETAPTAASEPDQHDPLFRREVLAAGAATGAAALGVGASGAGAQSNGGAEIWFDTTQPDHTVSNFQYNPNMWAGTTHAEHGLWAQYATYNWKTGEFSSHLVEDWTVDESEMVLTLREDFTWSDGTDLTAPDLMEQWRVYELTDHPLFDFADEIAATGDHELTISYPEGTNTNVVEHAVLHESANMPPQDWSDYEAGDGLTNYSVPEPTASGPIELTEQTANYHQYEPRPDHPYGENFDFDGYRMRHHDSNQAVHQALIDQDVDGLHSLFVGAATLNQFPSSVEEITFPGVYGMAMWFNHDREVWSDRSMRQAVQYTLDLEPILSALGQRKKIHHPTQTGLTDVAVQDWLGGYDLDGFDSYDRDPDQVSSLVSDAGYELGSVQPNFVAPAGWSDWVLMASLVGDQMGRAGWDVTVNTLGGAYWSRRANGEFDMIAGPHKNQAQHNEPFFGLRFQLYGQAGTPAVWSNYASPDGSKTVTIDGEDVDVEATFEELATTQDESTQAELVRTLAQVVNRDVPYVHVCQKYEQSFIDREYWAFPQGHPLLYTQWPLFTLPKTDEFLDDHLEDAPEVETPGLLKAGSSTEVTDQARFDVSVAAPSEAEVGGEATLDVEVTNVGDAVGEADVEVQFGNQSHVSTESLDAGSTWTESFSLPTDSVGDVTWSVQTQHDSASGTLGVVDDATGEASFFVSVTAPTEVTVGADATLQVTVTNDGDGAGDAEISVQYEDLTQTATEYLEPGGSWTSTYSLATEATGDVAWSVATQHGDASGTLSVVESGEEPDEQPTCGGQPVNATATVEGRTVCDVNGDDLFRDVDADGEVTQTDVVEFFRHQHREEWKRSEYFDFDGGGHVGHGDVVDLFEHVVSDGL